MSILQIALTIYGSIALFAIVLYIPKLRQFSFCFQNPRKKTAETKRRIAIIVPARDESAVIGDLFASIAKQDYDPEYFDVNVIVKEECDPTVAIAKKAGANVFVIPGQTCKGAALDGYFQTLTPRRRDSYAAFVIVDADAVLSENYVSELNNALEYGKDIYLTNKHVKNYFGGKKARSLFCNCSALNYPSLDEMGAYYRLKKNVPMNMCGQGLMVTSNVIKTLGGWPYRTLTEDYELHLDSHLKDFTSMYWPYAVIYTEEVIRHKDAWTRRLRWVMGFSQCDHMYKKAIRQKMKRDGASFFKRYDCFFSLAPLIVFIADSIVAALFGAGLTIYYAVTGNALWLSSLLQLTVMPLAVMYLLELLYCGLTMLVYRGAYDALPVGERIATWLFAPLFMFEFFPIFIQGQICLLTKKNLSWQKTARVKYESNGSRMPRERRGHAFHLLRRKRSSERSKRDAE